MKHVHRFKGKMASFACWGSEALHASERNVYSHRLLLSVLVSACFWWVEKRLGAACSATGFVVYIYSCHIDVQDFYAFEYITHILFVIRGIRPSGTWSSPPVLACCFASSSYHVMWCAMQVRRLAWVGLVRVV
jgi:hypothetical protein